MQKNGKGSEDDVISLFEIKYELCYTNNYRRNKNIILILMTHI
jgi:hypothetical protein